VTAIQAIVNPLVNWIWIGGIVLVLGTVVCLLPKFEKHAKTAEQREVAAPSVAAVAVT
jgi:cytochrome c biogenesis factor